MSSTVPKTPIQRLENLTAEELIDLANALRYFCPSSVKCPDCPLYATEHATDEMGACLALRAEREYFKRIDG